METILELKKVVKRFGELTAVNNIDLKISRGEKVVIVGPSGSGKSTLLRTMNFLETIDSGEIQFEGKPCGYIYKDGNPVLDSQKNLCALRSEIGMVFQQFNLFPHMTVLQNVMEGQVTVLGKSKDEAREVALQMLEKVGLSDRSTVFPVTLSGGQKQRVAIARALAMKPKMMLFDEPTSALDPELVGEVFDTIRSLADDGMTMVIVTHNMGFAREVADTVIFMETGDFIAKGTPKEFFSAETRHPRIKEFMDKLL
ncbi:amino acid ABC transporter ATP-binding protein [Desulfovibrio sp. JC022]|uniref:amino acid ABC transporter ATP-binding protein n=1 Tax=Desulfovibrio sp. JC022 TaxID=2593642 RepID=UPI0013D5388F|nr:amino acid ABC transporter ATP-binding protein [Desulfovibrio sp. JC022]NDV22514.1 amino acid ABC transporter ATP-binding protein [Desulfovibrio sp. JC022]